MNPRHPHVTEDLRTHSRKLQREARLFGHGQVARPCGDDQHVAAEAQLLLRGGHRGLDSEAKAPCAWVVDGSGVRPKDLFGRTLLETGHQRALPGSRKCRHDRRDFLGRFRLPVDDLRNALPQLAMMVHARETEVGER